MRSSRTLLRPDAWSVSQRTVRELKSDNSIDKGWRQLDCYKRALEDHFGGEWTAHLDIYRAH